VPDAAVNVPLVTQEDVPEPGGLVQMLGRHDFRNLGDAVTEMGSFKGCADASALRAVLRQAVEVETTAMLELIEDADAFDVIELMRLREFPPVPDPAVVAQHDGNALAVEVVAAVLLARGKRKPSEVPREETRPHESIPALHERASRLGRLGSYRHLFEGRLSSHVLAPLAAEYRSAVLSIRNLQYDSVRDEIERGLFTSPAVAPLMQELLGYSYDEMVAVREAMKSISGTRLTALRDRSGEAMLKYQDVAPAAVPLEVREAVMRDLVEMMFLPGQRAAITAEEVAGDAGLTVETAAHVMRSFAQAFEDDRSAADRVFDVLTGRNPFLLTPLVRDDAGNYALTANDIGIDSLRRIFEQALQALVPEKKKQTVLSKYNKARGEITEQLAGKAVAAVLRHPAFRTG
jgi:hypothetical protein